MLKTFWVAWREFAATVFTKGFLLGIILPPAIMTFALTLLPLLMNTASPKTTGTIAIIDHTGLVASRLAKAITPEAMLSRRERRAEEATEQASQKGINVPMDKNTKKMMKSQLEAGGTAISTEILDVDADVEAAKSPILKADPRGEGTIDPKQRLALVIIPDHAVRADPAAPASTNPDDLARFAKYEFYHAPKLDPEVRGDVSEQVGKAIVDARMEAAGIDPSRVRDLLDQPRYEAKAVTVGGDKKSNTITALFIPLVFLMLLWISVIVGGQNLLTSTIEEKSSRIMEVLLSAVSPMQLMVGKIVGQMAVSSIILVLYSAAGVGTLIALQQDQMLDKMLLVYAAIYFFIAFFLLASMMAAIGSAVNDAREAQALLQPIMLVMVVPLMLWMPISRNPNGVFAQVCSFIPPMSPFVMIIRLAGSESIPFWQVPVSIAIGIGAMVFMAWAAAKIFRVGVLMYGKPPNLRTLVRWIRMA